MLKTVVDGDKVLKSRKTLLHGTCCQGTKGSRIGKERSIRRGKKKKSAGLENYLKCFPSLSWKMDLKIFCVWSSDRRFPDYGCIYLNKCSETYHLQGGRRVTWKTTHTRKSHVQAHTITAVPIASHLCKLSAKMHKQISSTTWHKKNRPELK